REPEEGCMRTVCLQAGHVNVKTNCLVNMRGSTGAPGEAAWTLAMRDRVADLLRYQKDTAGKAVFAVTETDANMNCAKEHPYYDLTLAIHYQSNTGHSGFGVFVADPTFDRDLAKSKPMAKALAQVYAARTKLPNYSSP